ncbi:MAG: hypothetical protein KDB18_10905 [Salinibacterium sp.]|nr:hypothetical protein [Salinibacterium sp.]
MLRLEACDLFIHGLGGGASRSGEGYDRATESWAREWLDSELAPAVVVSADLRLDLANGQPLSTERELQRAANRAHSARHNPASIGEGAMQWEKMELVQRIAAATDRSARSSLFRELHGLLERHRKAHSGELSEVEAEADEARRRVSGARVAARRDWSFVLYPDDSIQALRSTVEALW